MKEKIVQTLLALLAVLFFAVQVNAAAFVKYDGVDGESKSGSDRPTEEVAFYYNKIAFSKIDARIGSPLVVHNERGGMKVLSKDGTYSTSRGEKIWVRNGKVVKSTVRNHPQSLRKGSTEKPTGMLLPAVQKVREKPTPDPKKKGVMVKGKKILEN